MRLYYHGTAFYKKIRRSHNLMSDKRTDHLTVSCFIAFNPILFSLFKPLIPFQHTRSSCNSTKRSLFIIMPLYSHYKFYYTYLMCQQNKKVIMNFIILLIWASIILILRQYVNFFVINFLIIKNIIQIKKKKERRSNLSLKEFGYQHNANYLINQSFFSCGRFKHFHLDTKV